MYIFCSFSVALRNINVHVSKNFCKKVRILVFKLTLSQCLPYIETLKMFSTPGNYLEMSWNFAFSKGEELCTETLVQYGLCHVRYANLRQFSALFSID